MLALLAMIAFFVIPIFGILGMWASMGWWTILVAPCVIVAFMGNMSENKSDSEVMRHLKLYSAYFQSMSPTKRAILLVRKLQILFGGLSRIVLAAYVFYYFYNVYDWNLFYSLLVTLPSIWLWWIASIFYHQ